MSAPRDEGVVCFSLADVDGFAAASGDESPLHVSDAYARSTPFGRRVVHGMLAVLVILGRVAARNGERLARLEVDLKAPLFAGIMYRIEVSGEGHRVGIRLCDGARLALRMVAVFVAGQPSSTQPRVAAALRREAAHPSSGDLIEGWVSGGSYAPPRGGIDAARALAGISPASAIGATDISILMGVSYLVGMEAPGEAALLSRVAVELAGEPVAEDAPLSYRLSVDERDSRFDLLRMTATFACDGVSRARAELEVFVRPPAAILASGALRALSPPASALAGQTAIVVGASRGLGAAIALALADQGCDVGLSFARSRGAAERVAALAVPGRITLLEADAEDAASFAPAALGFADAHGGLDILVCNACPALSSLSLDLACVARVTEYVARSLGLVAVPVAATLDRLVQRSGALVIVSSDAVVHPPLAWPHYVVAKAAVEGLARAVQVEAPALRCLVARPPRMRTDLVSSPGGDAGAIAPEVVAAALVRWLAGPHEGGLALIEDFGDGSSAA